MDNLTQSEVDKRTKFRRNIAPHLDALYRFALQLNPDPDVAEDRVLKTMKKAFRSYEGYIKDANIKKWLYLLLANSHFNKSFNEPVPSDPDKFEMIRGKQIDLSGIDESKYGELKDEDISKAMYELPVIIRSVLYLCDVESFSHRETGSILKIPTDAIQSLLHGGRILLKKKLVKYGEKRAEMLPA